ncbi:hypothetical protein GALMADRAFT_128490 [Galerina marginata CBS 339.88]|uniref:GED domain-containing protein n=1 Tax=Galerina marginata (strain CBS 339.88) TaxID=685588 RepID=A0A067SG52_GALM3|nr:hypothetical protein GALMADRAFT_128490 [Galerina marginata CBS 339.88]
MDFASPTSSALPAPSAISYNGFEENQATRQVVNSGVGLSNPKLSQGRRRMLDLVNRLHSTGVQVDIDLPQIAVIGSQSAGKSSLIESISGITLPRAAGTCTRCPTECRLSRSKGQWQCVVSLRFITDAQGQTLGQARNQVFGDVIYDKTEVEDRIRRAQKAILNPGKPAKHFLDGDEDDEEYESELSFSHNCVSLQISGPDVANLSFVDLPGLIASVSSSSKGSGDDITLVENLVKAYIKKPNCIILLTVACETDFENQGAHRLTKNFDPDGKRTIGVLTKPDRIPTGEESNWLPFIRGEKEPLENGWFSVKQPSSNDLKSKMTWDQARQKENEFFTSNPPWCELDAGYQKYLRTPNLVDRLSSILSDLISKRLPQIYEELEGNIANTRKLIATLPRPPSDNPQSEIATLLHGFVNDLAKHVEGVPDSDGLLQAIRPAQEVFRRAIRVTAPNFRPFEREFEHKRHIGRADFLVEEEGEAWGAEESEDEDTDAKGRKQKYHPSSKIYIDEVLARAHQARTRELPGHFPFVVQKTFIDAVVTKWEAPALVLCKTVHDIISEHGKKLVTKHLADFGQGHLEQRVKTILHQHIENCRAKAEQSISWLLKLEERPFSMNTHYLSDYQTKFLSHYRGERQRFDRTGLIRALDQYNGARSGLPENPAINNGSNELTGLAKVLSGLSELGLSALEPHDLQKLLPHDEMEPALSIMADVRAYFQVAYKRFADIIPLAIDQELVRGLERDLLEALYDQLGTNNTDGHEISKDLAQESPQVADKRADLGKKLERLETAQRELLGISV